MDLDTLLAHMIQIGGSDLHLKVDSPPMVCIDATLTPLVGEGILDDEALDEFVAQVTQRSPAKRESFYATGDLDTASVAEGFGRFRVNGFRQRGAISFAFRYVPRRVPSFEQLGLPPGVEKLSDEHGRLPGGVAGLADQPDGGTRREGGARHRNAQYAERGLPQNDASYLGTKLRLAQAPAEAPGDEPAKDDKAAGDAAKPGTDSDARRPGASSRAMRRHGVLTSYLALRGRCRTCGERIGLRYVAVELLTGVLVGACFLHFGLSAEAALAAFFCAALVALSAIDVERRLLPDLIVLPSFLVVLAVHLALEPGRGSSGWARPSGPPRSSSPRRSRSRVEWVRAT